MVVRNILFAAMVLLSVQLSVAFGAEVKDKDVLSSLEALQKIRHNGNDLLRYFSASLVNTEGYFRSTLTCKVDCPEEEVKINLEYKTNQVSHHILQRYKKGEYVNRLKENLRESFKMAKKHSYGILLRLDWRYKNESEIYSSTDKIYFVDENY